MRNRHHTRLLVAALMALLTSDFAGAAGLVLCVGENGHRAVELQHPGMDCPTLAPPQDTNEIFVQPSEECLDLPAAGTSPVTLSSIDSDRLPTPPVVALAAVPEPERRLEARLSGLIDARAGPPSRALHLRSTVLLV